MAKSNGEIRKILVPIDGSETSFKTARHALSLAKEKKSSITLLHVSEMPPLPLHGESLDKYYKEVREEAAEWLDRIKNFPEASGVSIETKVITTTVAVADVIVKFADDEHVDLIVIGTRGRSKISKLLMGSVTSGVTKNAHVKVLVVK